MHILMAMNTVVTLAQFGLLIWGIRWARTFQHRILATLRSEGWVLRKERRHGRPTTAEEAAQEVQNMQEPDSNDVPGQHRTM